MKVHFKHQKLTLVTPKLIATPFKGPTINNFNTLLRKISYYIGVPKFWLTATSKLIHPHHKFSMGGTPNFIPIIDNIYIMGLYKRLNKKIHNLKIKDFKAPINFNFCFYAEN